MVLSDHRIDSREALRFLVAGAPSVDVRAEVEFSEGHLPGAVNLPILNDQQRAEIGTVYKKQGREKAIDRGHALVSGEDREKKIQSWQNFFFQKKGLQAFLYCFRGGLRSQHAQQWLKEKGLDVVLLEGGYKALRGELLHVLENPPEMIVISGPTGSGKTHFLKSLPRSSVDLEALAHHKGSAFGFETGPQPSQALFENRLAIEILRYQNEGPLLVEDESRMIGQRVLPEKMFLKMRESPIVWIEESLAIRIENIFDDYVVRTDIGQGSEEKALQLFDRYQKSLMGISKKLGGVRTDEIMKDLSESRAHYLQNQRLDSNRVWIEKLLVYYYDPLYLASLERRQPQVLFRGPSSEALSYLLKA